MYVSEHLLQEIYKNLSKHISLIFLGTKNTSYKEVANLSTELFSSYLRLFRKSGTTDRVATKSYTISLEKRN